MTFVSFKSTTTCNPNVTFHDNDVVYSNFINRTFSEYIKTFATPDTSEYALTMRMHFRQDELLYFLSFEFFRGVVPVHDEFYNLFININETEYLSANQLK